MNLTIFFINNMVCTGETNGRGRGKAHIKGQGRGHGDTIKNHATSSKISKKTTLEMNVSTFTIV